MGAELKLDVYSLSGMIDQCWQDMKKQVPNALRTSSPWLLVYALSWQWRYINMSKNLLKVTATAVRKALS